MNKPLGNRGSVIAVALALGLPALALGGPRDIDSRVLDQLRSQGRADIFVKVSGSVSLDAAESLGSKTARGQYVFDTLNANAALSQQGLRRYLDQQAVGYQAFWINNSIFIRNASRDLVNALAARSDVDFIRANNRGAHIDVVGPMRSVDAGGVNAIEWNVERNNSPDVWASGNLGQGLVVANVDTGVRYTHTAIVNQYRGNTGAGFDHNYNWRDPSEICSNPDVACDNNGHGTHTMGTMVGGDGPGPFTNDIGNAPSAEWMACKGCESNSCSEFALLTCAEFIACPTRTDGTQPDCTQAPDIVNNSWSGGQRDSWYMDSVAAWRAAGIIPVFSAGNSGPSCSTINSPGDYPQVIAVGATTISNILASFSSKGPGSYAQRRLKPDFVAGGENVRSSVNSSDTAYALFSGTSMSAPGVVGSIALYLHDNPGAGYGQVHAAFRSTTAQDLGNPPNPDTCGNRMYNVYPNFHHGYGQVDAAAAIGGL